MTGYCRLPTRRSCAPTVRWRSASAMAPKPAWPRWTRWHMTLGWSARTSSRPCAPICCDARDGPPRLSVGTELPWSPMDLSQAATSCGGTSLSAAGNYLRRADTKAPDTPRKMGLLRLLAGGKLGVGEVAGDRRVDRNTRARRRRDRDLLQVTTLRGRRLVPQDLFERGGVVFGQRLLVERRLADDEVQVGLLVHPEVDLATLDVGHGLGDIGGD